VLAASGHYVFTLIATGAILVIHLLGRPLGHLIDHDNVVEEDEDDQPYQLQLVCRPKSEKYARAQIVQRTGFGGDRLVLRGIHTGRIADDSVELTAYLLSDGHAPGRLEQLVAELSIQEGVQAVHWYAGDDDDRMPRAR
jgi:putative Mg2+ transporter-C (MgtC) family protein